MITSEQQPNKIPKISIITPVLNAKKTLEKAIKSVISQDYPNKEHIIIDGGSTDGTVDLIRQYKNHIAYWISEPDDSAARATNKGITIATGEIICFLFGDDWFEPHTFPKILIYSLSQRR
jgi:glycosyltransferase involved in cell wall biosynthesis